MNEITTAVDWAARLGPSGILAVGLYVLWKKQLATEAQRDALQELRVTEAKAYADRTDQRATANTTAMLALYEKVEQIVNKIPR